ncbi:MAG: metallophosphoesterase [Deltaproteobacteria bacterium]|nr:metallophosphoesterase [Deltaproteobacteria bacterium]
MQAATATRSVRIAHLSDVHVLARRGPRSGAGLSTRIVSLGRSLDPEPRFQKLVASLRAARAARATHYVVSGDLTETGEGDQFEAFAEAIHHSGVPHDRVVLVPGNHDAYARHGAWARALEGPLAPFRALAADAPGKVIDHDEVVFLPLDVACHQKITRSAGELSSEAADALEHRLRGLSGRGRALVAVLHHHPFEHSSRAWQWVDGLRGSARLMAMLDRFHDLQVLHGHLHRVVDRGVGSARVRILGAPATVEDRPGAPSPRLYDVVGESLVCRSVGAQVEASSGGDLETAA